MNIETSKWIEDEKIRRFPNSKFAREARAWKTTLIEMNEFKKDFTKNDLFEACYKTLRWGSDERASEQERIEFAEYFNELVNDLNSDKKGE